MSQARFLLLVTIILISISGCTDTSDYTEMTYINADGDLIIANIDLTQMKTKSRSTLGHNVTHATWDNTGDKLAYIADNTLYVLTLDTDTIETFADELPVHTVLSWAPAGNYLAVDLATGFPGELVLYQYGESHPLDHVAYLGNYVWSPLGTTLALGRSRTVDPPMPWDGGYSSDLIIFHLTSGEVNELIVGCSQFMYIPLAWDHDGLLVWEYDANDNERTLLLVDPDTAETTAIDVPPHLDLEHIGSILPDHLKDGFTGRSEWLNEHVVAVIVHDQGRDEVWIVNYDDDDKPVTLLVDEGYVPMWRPETN